MKISFRAYWDLLIKYLSPQKKMVGALTLVLFIHIAFQLINPQILRNFIDAVQVGEPMSELLNLAGIFIAIAILRQFFAIGLTYTSENVAWTATNALRQDLAEHSLGQRLSFFNRHTPGELIERIDGDVNTLAEFFSQFVIQLLGNGLLLIGVIVLLFREDWRIGLVIGSFVLVAFVILYRLRNIAVPHWDAERQANADLFSFLEERLSSTEDIKANGAVQYVMHKFIKLMRTLFRKSVKAGLIWTVFLNSMWTIFAVGNALAFAISAYLFKGEIITLGSVYIIFQYTNMLERPISQITRQLGDLQKSTAGIKRVKNLFAENFRQSEENVDAKISQGFLENKEPIALKFEKVLFGYEDDLPKAGEAPKAKDMVLNGIDFELQPGKVLGLLGRTGSGKTTLTRLIYRFYDPDQGTVYVNGFRKNWARLDQIALSTLRGNIGMVTQNIQLFNASLRENITFFDSSIPDEKILGALKNLDLIGWFESLPDGLDTMMESDGGDLSAGEAQLLAFTRIYLKDPRLIILDEASSRLDPATEAMVEKAVKNLVKNRTAIIIAHRLKTILSADEIMILDHGEIEEFGSRRALQNDPNSRFSKLLQTGMEEVLV